jgi:tetratricopeptide (TPR) repeat protein
VRRANDKLRINAQLIDATTGGHLWAERYDGSIENVFELQDKITQSIVTALAVNLTAGEQEQQARKETGSPEAYDAFLRGWAHYRLDTPGDFAKAIPYLENAIELDPSFGRAHAALAAIYWGIWDHAWSKIVGVSYIEATAKTNQHLKEAMKDPTPLAHRIAAKQHGSGERWGEAMAEAERAIALDPNDPNGYEAMSILLVDLGRAAEGLDFIKKAMRLDPQSDYLFRLGNAQFHLELYDEAAATLLRATKRNPGYEWNFLLLAAAYGHLGREQEAKSAIDTFEEMWRNTQKDERPFTLSYIHDWPFKKPVDRERLREGLRIAGLPEGETALERLPLTAAVLRSLFPGNTGTGEVAGGDQWHIYHVPDGRLLIRNPGGHTDEGTWEITDDGQFCRQWNSGGRKACWIYFKNGDELEYWYPDRSRMRGKFKIRLGNPENL